MAFLRAGGERLRIAGGSRIKLSSLGWMRERSRTWYETNRPIVVTSVDKYLDLDKETTGDGTIGNAWNASQLATARGVAAGTYLHIKGSLSADYTALAPTNTGTAEAWIVYGPWDGGAAPVLTGAYCYLTASHSYVCLDGLTLDGNSLSITAVVYLSGALDCMVRNCTIQNANGVYVGNGSHRAWVEANTFVDCGSLVPPANNGEAILVKGTGNHDVVVYNNVIGECGHMAISVARSAGTAYTQENEDCRVAFNTITNTYSGGIAIGSASYRTIVEGNDVYDVGTTNSTAGSQMGLQLQGIDGIIRYNRFVNTGEQGMTFFCSSGGSIPGPVSGNRVYHNVFYGCGATFDKEAISFIDRSAEGDELDFINNEFANNIVYDSGYFVFGGNQTFIYIEIGAVGNYTPDQWIVGGVRTLAGNVIKNNLWGRASHEGTPKLIEYLQGGVNTWYDSSEAESAFSGLVANNVWSAGSADPSFVSTTPADALYLAIPAGSAAKDAGLALTGYDYAGTAPDIGGYEVA